MSKQTMIQPQEIEIFYIIPTLRKELAVSMKESGLKQKDIASLLHIEGATVSHYLNNKRGSKVEFSKEIKKEVRNSAKRIHDTVSMIREMQKLLSLIRSSCELCRIHKELESNVPRDCTPELVSCAVGETKHV